MDDDVNTFCDKDGSFQLTLEEFPAPFEGFSLLSIIKDIVIC